MEKYEIQGGGFFSRHLLQCKEYSLLYAFFVKSSVFGSGESRAAGRVSGWKNWTSGIFMHLKNNCFVPYLDFIQKDLDEREELGIDI